MLEDLVRPGDAARILKVDPATLRRWRREGLIDFVEMPSGKSWRYPASELRRILTVRNGTPVQGEQAYA